MRTTVAEADLRDAGVVPVQRTIPWADPAELPEVEVDLEALDRALGAPDDDDSRHTEERNSAE